MSAVGIGIVGSGVISDTYLENLGAFPDVEVVMIGDLNVDRAKAQAQKHGVPRWGTAADVMSDAGVQVVINLTIPAAHVEVSMAAIAAGKHVWTEKPIGLDLGGVDTLLRTADAAGLRVGAAPDTVLGPGLQTAKRAIARGMIGEPLFAHTSFQTQGPDLWHPGPQFLFTQGAGPLFDMGPYYFTALVSLLGSVDRVAAVGMKARAEREIRTGPNAGTRFPVEVPTTLQVLTVFDSGQQAQSTLSFDSALERHGVVEIHGTEGSLVVPDPNTFAGRTALCEAPRHSSRRRGVRAALDRNRAGRRGRRSRAGAPRDGACHRRGASAHRHGRARSPCPGGHARRGRIGEPRGTSCT